MMPNHARVVLLLTLCIAPFGPTHASASDGDDLLARCIAYHDPSGTWMQSRVRLSVQGSSADGRVNIRNCTIDNRNGGFTISVVRDGVVAEQGIIGGEYWSRLGGRDDLSDAESEEHNLNLERAKLMRDCMGYLWGLPMKLRDPGTHVDPTVASTNFHGQDVLDIKITYDAEVGGDIWHVYVDPTDAHMVGYAFYHDVEETDGEYITLEGETRVGEARIPQVRSWYRVVSDEFLGTDTLLEGEQF